MSLPKRVILIQEDEDGTIRALTTDKELVKLTIDQYFDENIFKTVRLFAEPYEDKDVETWSDWCHSALMKIWRMRNFPLDKNIK